MGAALTTTLPWWRLTAVTARRTARSSLPRRFQKTRTTACLASSAASSGAEASAFVALGFGLAVLAALGDAAPDFPATAARAPAGATFFAVVAVVVDALVPPAAAWTFALAASLVAAAPFAASTSLPSPVTPGAVGVEAGVPAAGSFGFSTVNQSAQTASRATRAMRKGGLIW